MSQEGRFRPYTEPGMPRVSRLKLPPLPAKESIGERVARIRKERGFTQVELAEKIGVIQSIVSAIERDVLKLSAEMAIRFALALEVTTDDLLMPAKRNGSQARSRAGRFYAAWRRSKHCPERNRRLCSRPSTTLWSCTC